MIMETSAEATLNAQVMLDSRRKQVRFGAHLNHAASARLPLSSTHRIVFASQKMYCNVFRKSCTDVICKRWKACEFGGLSLVYYGLNARNACNVLFCV